MFGVIKSMSHRKLLRQYKNRPLDLNIFIISNVQLFLRVGKDTKPWNTNPLQEKPRHSLSVYTYSLEGNIKQWDVGISNYKQVTGDRKLKMHDPR